jgi:hypothetical protein
MTETAASVPRSSRRRRLLAPVTAAAAVAALLAGLAVGRQLQTTSTGGGRPPTLHLVGPGGVELSDQGWQGPGGGGAGLFGYEVEGTLPVGPARGRVRQFSERPAATEAVSRLATTLGVAGTPVRDGAGWVVSGSGTVLQVSDSAGWPWTLGQSSSAGQSTSVVACDVVVHARGCPPVATPNRGKVVPIEPPNAAAPPGAAGDTGTGSSGGGSSGGQPPSVGTSAPDGAPGGRGGAGGAPAPGGADGAPAPGGAGGAPEPGGPANPPSPSAGKVRAAAGPVLAALGLDRAPVGVQTYPALGLVTAAPVLDGLPTSGYETRLSYDLRLHLTGGTGWLGTATPAAEYPLVSAQRALDTLPTPEVAVLPCPKVQPAKCRSVRAKITGARPGLLLSWQSVSRGPEQALLVPAWLFDVRGWPAPLPVVAVDLAYLAPGARATTPPGVPAPLPVPPAAPNTGSAMPARPAPGTDVPPSR